MKVKGLSLTQPVCDLRPLVAKDAILDCFRGGPLHRKTFLRGFGKAGERFKLSMPWRPTDTIYLDCRRAISLPDLIPIDKRYVYRLIRRVYCDGYGLVRFELGFFLHPKHHSPPSRSHWQQYGKEFWAMDVMTDLLGQRENLPLFKALRLLVDHFVKSTTPHPAKEKLRANLCHSLNPQLQVMIDIGDVVEAEQAIPLDSEDKSFLRTEVLRVQGRSEPVDAICLLFRRDVDLRWRRLARAHMSRLHADLEVLSFLVQRYRDEEPPPSVVDYVERLANGFRAVPTITDAHRIALLSLLKVESEIRADRRSRLAAAIETTCFPSGTKTRLREVLQTAPSEGGPTHKINEQMGDVGQLETKYRLQRLAEVITQFTDTEGKIASGRGSEKAERDEVQLRYTVRIINSELLDPGQTPFPPDILTIIEANKAEIKALAEYFHSYYTGPSEKTLVGYLKQFGNARWVELALILLNGVDFYTHPKTGEIFYDYVVKLPENVRNKAVFVPLGGPRDSAYTMTYNFCKGLKNEKNYSVRIMEIREAIDTYQPEEAVVFFVDDNVGSGEQATRIFREWFDLVRDEHKHVNSLDERGRSWLRNCPFINYFVVVGFLEGMDALKSAVGELGLNLKIEPAILKREVEGCFSPSSNIFRINKDREEACEMAKVIGYQLFQDKHDWTNTKKRNRALGYGNSQKLIVFSHNTPPSTLPILWKEGNFNGIPWIPLFPRR